MGLRLACAALLDIFFFQAEDGIRDLIVTGVQTCALPICRAFAASVGLSARAALLRIEAAKARPDLSRARRAAASAYRRLGRNEEAMAELKQIGRASCRERV